MHGFLDNDLTDPAYALSLSEWPPKDQADRGTVNRGDYSLNTELILRAQSEGGESEDAMEALSAIIELNKGLVKKIVLRFKDRGVEEEDLMQIGTIGMIKAVRSFDSDRGTCFSTYAVPLIFGEIRRYLRDEGPIKVGRNYKRLGAAVMNCKNRILAEVGNVFDELAKQVAKAKPAQ